MTISEAIQMLNAVRDVDAPQSLAENMGNVHSLYDDGLRRVSQPIVERYQPGGFEEFWKTYGSSGADLMMKFEAGAGLVGKQREGKSPSGGSWEDWDEMEWDQRLVSLSDEFIEEWVKDYKDLTLADASLIKNGDFGPLARHIRNIITGGNTHGGQAGLFASEAEPTSLASVAGIHDKTKTGQTSIAMLLEVLSAWIVFMVNDPEGVVKRVSESFKEKVSNRVSAYA